MAEQTLSELVMNLISWIESLHEKNLKYEAQVETLSRDLAKAQNSNEELEAQLSAYQINSSAIQANIGQDCKTGITSVPVPSAMGAQIAATTIHPTGHHQPPPTAIYQPIAAAAPVTFASQPSQYVWTAYDTSGHDIQQVPYYDTYGSFQQTQSNLNCPN